MEPIPLELFDSGKFGRIVWCVENTSACDKHSRVFNFPGTIGEMDFDLIHARHTIPFRRRHFGVEDQIIVKTVFLGQALPVLLENGLNDMGSCPIRV